MIKVKQTSMIMKTMVDMQHWLMTTDLKRTTIVMPQLLCLEIYQLGTLQLKIMDSTVYFKCLISINCQIASFLSLSSSFEYTKHDMITFTDYPFLMITKKWLHLEH
ncbi:hypothetical protein K7X08_005397 [Anisodus acutangulus]|uniref:Uncharacterized protein n=1 Tax=Anisodus acutangulus TaxID=402998 RepID=A0A9Q1LTC7_9SOLA|nr:hypothetical protein K7X08_005397 [Anisodus acutangulus]